MSTFVPVRRQKIPAVDTIKALWFGARSMFGAILILLFAWGIGGVIGDMATGTYLSTLVQGNLDPMMQPVSCCWKTLTGMR